MSKEKRIAVYIYIWMSNKKHLDGSYLSVIINFYDTGTICLKSKHSLRGVDYN